MKHTLLVALLSIITAAFAKAQTTVYSQSGGNWTTLVWNTMADGSGSNVTDPNSSTTSVVIQSNHAVVLNNGPRDVQDITVQVGATLNANTSTNRYIQVFGTSVVFDGNVGGGTDGISLDINGATCTLSGSGAIQLARLRKDNDPGQAATTDLTIQSNITLIFAGTCLYNNSPTRTFNVTLENGKTITLTNANGDVSIDGTNGSPNGVDQMGTFTVNGTLDIQGSSGDLFVRTDNTSAGANDISYVIGSSGTIKVGGTLHGNNGSNGAAISKLTINNGGILELKGTTATANVSGTRDNFDLQTGSTVIYSGASAQAIESKFTYSNLTVSGGSKTTNGNVTASGTVMLSDCTITLNANTFTVGSSGNITGAGANGYIQTNGTGELIQQVTGSDVEFPVGNSSYNPITLNNTGGTVDNYRIRVLDDVFTNGTIGAVITDNVVDRTWLISEQVAGGTNLDITVQWNSAEELGTFDNTACYVSHYFGGFWNPDMANAAGGSDPYSRTRTGITSISAPSPFAVGSNTELPIELATLTAHAQKRDILLRWETASERDNAYFAIERSNDGNTFREIDQQPSMGNSRSPQTYTYTDFSPAKGTNYYRLRQVDTDARYAYSPVVTAVMEESFVRLSPSAATDVLRLTASEPTEETHTWQVFDTAGRLLQSGIWEAESVQHEVSVSDLPQGHYVLRLTAGQQSPVVLRFQKM